MSASERLLTSGDSNDAGETLQVEGRKCSLTKKSRPRAPDADATWSLEPHVCRHCFGRLVSQGGAGSDGGCVRYRCTNCGAEADGPDPSVLCSCGIRLQTGRGAEVDAGIRCAPNPKPSTDFPSLFVALQPPT